MKRWFIARMGDYEGDGSLVPKTNLYPCNTRIWSKAGFAFCLGQLGAADLTAISADPDIRLIPDASLDNLLTSIPAGVRSSMIVGLTNGGFDVSAVKSSWSIRQLLKHLKLQLQADDNIESGDVRDLG
jgi:hypothetical protein